MIRQYGAQRARGGDNPLRVGVIAVGSIYYLQDQSYFRDPYGGTAVHRTPWQVQGFLNGTLAAARRNSDTGAWEDTYRSGRSDMALVRSLRDRRIVRQVSVHSLIAHDDLGLSKGPTAYPTLPDLLRFRQGRCRSAQAAAASWQGRRAA